MFHKDILNVSYKHRYEIRKAAKDILGLYDIHHFSLDLVSPDGEMVFLSSTPSHGYAVCSRGYGPYDATIAPEYYENNTFYWWSDVKHRGFHDEINFIKQVELGFADGFMLVRKWAGFYLIYSYATRSQSPEFRHNVLSNLNQLLQMGDFIYAEMCDIYSEYAGDFTPPVIDVFHPFESGKPMDKGLEIVCKPKFELIENKTPELIVATTPQLQLVSETEDGLVEGA